MDLSICRIGLATALLALAGTVSAQATTVDEAAANEARDAPAATDQTDQGRDAVADRFCVRETGSRIPAARRVGTKDNAKGCLSSNGRSYSRDDLRNTGRTDLADALRALDPSIY